MTLGTNIGTGTISMSRPFIGSFEFDSDGLIVWNPANTFKYTITAAAISADRVLNLPLTTATDTLVCLGITQTFTATQNFQTILPSTSVTYDLGSATFLWNTIYSALGLTINANNYGFKVNGTTSGLYFSSVAPRNIALHINGVEKHVFYMGAAAHEGAFYHIPRTGDTTGAALNGGSFYVFNNGGSDYWLKIYSQGVWIPIEQRETISVTPGATVTLTHNQHTNVYAKWTAGENETVNASGSQSAGQRMDLLILNDGTSARTITFGTGFKPSGTIVGTINKLATICFTSDGTDWWETSRTLLL